MMMSLRWLLVLLFGTLLITSCVLAQEDDTDLEDEEEVEEPVQEEDEPAAPPITRPEYRAPKAKGEAYFADAFESVDSFSKSWVMSTAKKDGADEELSKYDGKWSVEEASDNPLIGDLGLVLKSKAKHHAVAALLNKPFKFSGDPFIMQYEVKFQNGQECGGAYVKLLSGSDSMVLGDFHDKSPYTIMFGPDKCGQDSKLHFIFRHKNPKTGEFEEKHAKKPTKPIENVFTDKKTHLFTLVVSPDNTFEIYVDQDMVNSGSLLEDFDPPVNPPKEIVDPDDKKPEDWDEREKIPDPDATKPEDWDESEPEMIPDPDATKPEGWLDDEAELVPDPNAEKPSDWDDDMDGEWEAPQINNPKCEDAPGCGEWTAPEVKNPKYKGKWRPPMIDNPEYKGKWKPRKIPNPDFFEDKDPYKMTPIGALGLELWSMSDDILFDNFIITSDKGVADDWAEDSWQLKRTQELAGSSSSGIFQTLYDAADERKWLWAVYAVAVLLPIAILSVWLCPNKGPGIKAEDIARHKKTDEATPDDVDGDKEGDEGAGGDATAEAAAKTTAKKSKSDLEAEQAEEADVEEEEEEEEDEEEEKVEEKKEEEPKPTKRTSPRKRTSRKE